MNSSTRKKWLRRKRRIAKRLRPRAFKARAGPMLAAGNVRYEMADRTRAVAHGGIGSLHLLARKVGLVDAIDRDEVTELLAQSGCVDQRRDGRGCGG